MTNKNEFARVLDEMQIDRTLLPILCNANRSTLHKYIDGSVSVPASALTLIKLLQFLQNRDEKLFAEWATLQDFQVPREVYLKDREYFKGWQWARHKIKPVLLDYLEGLEREGKL